MQPSQVEVTKSSKPIKKMINIHVGDLCAGGMGSPFFHTLSHTHTHIYIMGTENSIVQPIVTAVSWEVKFRRLI